MISPEPDLYIEYGWPDRDGTPSPAHRALVVWRANGYCEWPGCRSPGSDVHHRLNRKAGGRAGASADRVNAPSALVVACRRHHHTVTSAHGGGYTDARRRGWVLHEHEDPAATPILTRHRLEPVYLTDDGGWWPTTIPRPPLHPGGQET
jgi:hypothetical protein